MKMLNKLLGLCLVGVLAASTAMPAYAAGGGKITVTGQGAVKVNPDMATVNLGVTTKDVDAKGAQTKNAAITQDVLAVLKELGIADKDVQTSYYSIYPDYGYQMRFEPSGGDESEITGYTVTNSLNITVKDISVVGAVLEKTVAAGANYGGGITFGISDSQQYYERALALAIENAGGKGAAMAKAIGVSIGAPIEITEQGSYYMPAGYGMTNNISKDAAVPVQQGTLDVTATVLVTYEY